jgi:tungstate transport system ATP-binding protein
MSAAAPRDEVAAFERVPLADAPDARARSRRPDAADDGMDASSARPLVALQGASVRYGALLALRDVRFALHRGEFVALVGANGSGKTTLLRLLHGLAPAERGARIERVAGTVQAMVFQRPFMLRLSVRNNLRLALWLARRRIDAPTRSRRVDEALRRVGLQELAQRPARVLSGGEQQRLALARAWAVRPDVLYLDEPTANLDPSAKKEVESLLAGFAAEGMTLVMSTHNLGQAKRLASRVVYLDRGVVEADLPTASFFAERGVGRVGRFLKGELPWSAD